MHAPRATVGLGLARQGSGPLGAGSAVPNVSDAPDLVAVVRAADEQHGLFPRGGGVVVGVSGGPDSTALLHALAGYALERPLPLHAGHLDHLLRPGSQADAAAVSAHCEALGVPLTLAARDVGRLAAELGRGIEEAGRMARYGFLAALAARVGATTVAVGHQADDQAETVLMHFVRGSGLAGLKGMSPLSGYPLSAAEIEALEGPPASGSAGWPPRLARPLLAVPRSAVERFLAVRGIEARRDPSNDDPSFLRNRLRHEILPLLESVNPRLREALVRNAAAIADDLAVVEAAVDAAWAAAEVEPTRVRFGRTAWRGLPPGVQRGLLRRAVHHLAGAGRDLGLEHVDAARRLSAEGATGQRLSLPHGLRVEQGYEGFEIGPDRPAIPPPRLSAEPVPLRAPGETRLPGGWTVSAELRPHRPGAAPPGGDAWTELFFADVFCPVI
jgi:tRNA(Ile)-lysidine synthetase-like protein